MAKRTATRDINHENWDQEDEPEEAGTFQRATEEQLKARVIKTAKRRNLSDQGGGKSAFSAFAGFGKPQAPPTSSTFSFLSNVPPKTNGSSTKITPAFKMTDSTAEKNGNLDEYYSKLKGLNESVASFIKNRIETNPLVNLQPVFKDYEKYINDLEKLRENLLAKNKEDTETKSQTGEKQAEKTAAGSGSFVFKPAARNPLESFSKSPEKAAETPITTTPPTTTTTTQFSFGVSSGSSMFGGATKSATTPTFSFGAATDANKPTTATGFTFGAAETPKKPATGFSFGAAVTSPFALPTKPAETGKTEQEDEDSEPPKAEFTPVVEEGHVYTTRCKVFVKKDGSFSDRGVGNLFLKPVPGAEKVQVIVRADTSLGNLLCNFILSASVPTQRLGKKDVMLVCIPTPETKPPPVPVLLRVKSPEEADLLLETLEKHKK